ncbi:MAG: hypothetical protein ACP5I1_16255, partial [Candidatus Hinthialibacter sp.]
MNQIESNNNSSLTPQNFNPPPPVSLEELTGVLDVVKRCIDVTMEPGVDYGPAYPGASTIICYQGGIDKLGVLFRLVPKFHKTQEDLGDGHRNIEFRCELYDFEGRFLGEGHGSCCTLEDAFRGPFQALGDVPKAYWDDPAPDPERRRKYFGSEDYFPKKEEGRWVYGQRTEVKPQINYNNCLKRAQKRAWADAVYRRTGARNFFEDFDVDNQPAQPQQTGQKPSNGKILTPPNREDYNKFELTLFKKIGIGVRDGNDNLLEYLNGRGKNYTNNDEIRIEVKHFMTALNGARIET